MRTEPVRFLASGGMSAVLLAATGGLAAWASLLPPPRAAAVFGSRAFALLLALLFINILLGMGASVKNARSRPWGPLIRAGALLVLIGAFLGKHGGVHGYARLYDGQRADEFRGDSDERILPGFSIRLDRFSVTRYAGGRLDLGISVPGKEGMELYPVKLGTWTGPEEMRVLPLRYLPDFRIGGDGSVGSAGRDPNNPALEIEVRAGSDVERGWLFARFPSMPPPGLSRTLRAGRVVFFDRGSERIKSYSSEVTVFEGNRAVASGTVEVNRPLAVGGYRIYQSAYDPVGWQWSGLKIVRDPGLPLVYGGFALLALGITLWTGLGKFE